MNAGSVLTPIVIGLAAAAGVGRVIDAVAPKPIEVHAVSLTGQCEYDGQSYGACISQDRTVTPPGGATEYVAQWRAWLINTATGEVVPGCSGQGSGKYDRGTAVVQLPLHVWIGSDACRWDTLPPGEYAPHAAWDAGTQGEEHAGTAFQVSP